MSKRNRKQRRSNTLLDIVIPVYGRFDLLKLCLEAIPKAAQDISYQIILVDNNSPEGADEFYGTTDSIIVRNKENRGFPKACNQGAKHRLADSPLIFFLNSDVILHPGAINNMVMAMDDPNVGIVGAKLLFPKDTPSGPEGRVQHVGLATNINGDFEHLFIGWKPDNPKVMKVREVLAVTGAAMMIRRSIFLSFGGFDEMFGNGTYEDVDLCLKVRLAKKDVIVEQSAVGWHYTNATVRQYGIGFPVMQNKSLFLSRWMNQYPWTSWMHL